MSEPATGVLRGVRALMPQLKRLAATAIALDALTILLCVRIIHWAWSSDMADKPKSQIFFLSPLLALSLVGVIHFWMRRRQQALVMPVLAQSVGLRFSPEARRFIDRFPRRVLPERGVPHCKNLVGATLGAHEFQMAELVVVTGRKNTETLFNGIAVWFPNRTPLPAFYLFQDRKTRNGAIIPRELSPDGLRHLRDISSLRRTYGIWTSEPLAAEPPALSGVVDSLLRLEERLDQGSELYSASSSGTELHLLISHRRNLFQVGGTFLNEARLLKAVQAAMEDLKIALDLAQVLFEAERASAKS